MLIDSITLIASGHSINARACACAELFAGITAKELASMLGVNCVHLVRTSLSPLVVSGCLSRSFYRGEWLYRITKAGRKLVREDQARVRAESLAVLERMLANPRCKVEKVEPLLSSLRSDLP